jgi:hypothetical protein
MLLLMTRLEDRIQVRKAATKSLLPVLPALSPSLRMVHWSTLQFAEAQLWMDLTDNLAKFRTRPQKAVNLSDLIHDGEGLLADCLAIGRAVSGARARLFPRGGVKHRANRRGEDAAASLRPKQPSCPDVAIAPTGLVRITQAYWNIDRHDIEFRAPIDNLRHSGDLPDTPLSLLAENNSPTAGCTIDASGIEHMSSPLRWLCKRWQR